MLSCLSNRSCSSLSLGKILTEKAQNNQTRREKHTEFFGQREWCQDNPPPCVNSITSRLSVADIRTESQATPFSLCLSVSLCLSLSLSLLSLTLSHSFSLSLSHSLLLSFSLALSPSLSISLHLSPSLSLLLSLSISLSACVCVCPCIWFTPQFYLHGTTSFHQLQEGKTLTPQTSLSKSSFCLRKCILL